MDELKTFSCNEATKQIKKATKRLRQYMQNIPYDVLVLMSSG